MKTAIVILAAGKSSRMGQPKQLLKISDKTLLQLAVETALAADCSEVICILGAYKNRIAPTLANYSVTLIENKDYEDGLSSSLIKGLDYLTTRNYDAALMMLGDQPSLKSSHINSLLTLSREHPNDIVATTYPNTIGVPAIYPKRFFNALRQLQGDKGAKEFLLSKEEEIHKVPHPELLDIDTLDDYETYIKTNRND